MVTLSVSMLVLVRTACADSLTRKEHSLFQCGECLKHWAEWIDSACVLMPVFPASQAASDLFAGAGGWGLAGLHKIVQVEVACDE